jgi:hypothetical protein
MRLGRYGDEIAMTGNSHKVFVGGEQRESVLTACSGNQEIDGAGIDSLRAAYGL